MIIPNEMQSYIFGFLDFKALVACSRVCKEWYVLATDDRLWKVFCDTIDVERTPENAQVAYKKMYEDAILTHSQFHCSPNEAHEVQTFEFDKMISHLQFVSNKFLYLVFAGHCYIDSCSLPDLSALAHVYMNPACIPIDISGTTLMMRKAGILENSLGIMLVDLEQEQSQPIKLDGITFDEITNWKFTEKHLFIIKKDFQGFVTIEKRNRVDGTVSKTIKINGQFTEPFSFFFQNDIRLNMTSTTTSNLLIYCTDRCDFFEAWDLETEEKVLKKHLDRSKAKGKYICSHASKKVFGVGTSKGYVVFFDYATENNELSVLKAHRSEVTALLFINGYIISGSAAGTIKIWDLKTQKCLQELTGHTGKIEDIKVYKGKLYTTAEDKTLKIWNFVPQQRQQRRLSLSTRVPSLKNIFSKSH